MARLKPAGDANEAFYSALLTASKATALRGSSVSELRHLIAALVTSCETSRLAALRYMSSLQKDAPRKSHRDRNCGFAESYSALRRTRAELQRRESFEPGQGLNAT